MTTKDHNLDKAACDDWTKIPIHCAECGAQFLRKIRHQKYCDEHRHMAGAVIRPQEALTSNQRVLQGALARLIDGVRSVNIDRREWYTHIAQPLQDAYQALGGPTGLGMTAEEIARLRDESPVETTPSLALDLRSYLHGGPAPALHDGVTGKAKCVICGNFNRFWHVISACNYCQSCVSEALRSPEEPSPPHPGPSIEKAFANSPRRVVEPTAFQDFAASLPEKASARPIPPGRMCNTHGNWNCSECCPPENGTGDAC